MYGLSRRDMVKALGLLLGSSAIGCSKGGSAGADAGPAPGADAGMSSVEVWGAWESLRQGLRSSPDHLVAAAERAVATRDPQAILDFVTSQIADVLSFDESPSDSLRWGARGALRGGAGTPRDKAELLAELYRRAGFTTRMFRGTVVEERFADRFQRPVARTFAPALTPEQLARINAVLGVPPGATGPTVVDADDVEAEALVQRLLAALDDPGLEAAPVPGGAGSGPNLRTLPIVEVTTASGRSWANPFVTSPVFGEAYTEAAPEPLGEPTPAPRLRARVEAVTNRQNLADPPITLVDGAFALDELVGRQLSIGFSPAVSLPDLAGTRLDEVNAWAPFLSVVGPEVDAETTARLTIAETVITRDVRSITRGDDGEVRVDRRVVPSGAPTPSLLARVDRLELSLEPSGYPTIQGRVAALDAQGAAILGIAGSAFEVTEDDRRTHAVTVGAADVPPRIALLFDVSSSVPDEFRLPERLQALTREIAQQVVLASPQAELRVGSVGGGPTAEVGWGGAWTRDLGQLERDVAQMTTDGSDLWRALAYVAANEDATAIVLATDGVPTDESTAAYREALQSGPPVLVLRVGAAEATLPSEVAALSQGLVFAADTQREAIAAAASFVRSPRARPVTFSYEARVDGPAERTVRVRLGSKVVALSYRVPAQIAEPTRLAGLRLVLEIGERRVERDLAGWFTRGEGPVTAADLRDTAEMLSSVNLISFEPGSPSFSQLAEDLITSRVSQRPMVEAIERADSAAFLSALGTARAGYSTALLTLHGPFTAEADDPLPGLVRAVRLAVVPRPTPAGGFALSLRTDILPFARFSAAGDDRRRALIASMRSSARLALLEAAGASASALGALASKPLLRVRADGIESDFPRLDPALRARWRRALDKYPTWRCFGAADGAAVAFFAIDPETGTFLAVDERGEGGAERVNCAAFRQSALSFSVLGLSLGIAGLLGASVSPVVLVAFIVAKGLVGLIYIATLRINGLDAGGALVGLFFDAAWDVLGLGVGAAVEGGVSGVAAIVGGGFMGSGLAGDFLTTINLGASSPLSPSSVLGLQSPPC